METDVRRQQRSGLRQLTVHFFAKSHNIIARYHLHIQDQTCFAVKLDILFGRLVPPHNRCDIFEPDDTSCDRIGPNDLLLHFVFRLIGNNNLQRALRVTLPAYCAQPLQCHLRLQSSRVDAIPRELLYVNRDCDLLGLLTHNTQFTHLGDRAQRRTHLLGIFL